MKIPQLPKKLELKSCHNTTWEDHYSWIHQENILDVLRDKSKLDPEVKKYSKNEILKSYKKIMKKIHPDISPELTRLATLVNEAKEILIK